MDNFEKIRLSDKKGQLFTYSIDYLSDSPDTPQPVAVVNLEGGGRIISVITDRDLSEIKMGMPLEMTFRRLHTVNGIHNYYWKTTASRG
tara:strand:+ start:38 stop:304 length:267 start_codon:yes stop_codon:yes gene_type:complete